MKANTLQELCMDLYHQSRDGIAFHKGPVILELNETACDMLGYSREELIGRCFHDFHPKEEGDRVGRTAGNLQKLRNEGFIRFEQIYRRGDNGNLTVLEVSATVLNHEEDLLLTVFRDNTKVANRISEVEDIKRIIYAGPHKIGTWEWYVNENRTTVDDALLSLYGATREVFSPNIEFWIENLHPEDRNSTLAILRKHLEQRTGIYEDRFRFKHWQKGWVWIYASGMVVERDNEGRPIKMVGCHRDISEEINLIEEKNEQEKLFRLMFEASSSPIVFHDPVFDEDGTFQSVIIADINKAYETTLGVKREDVVSRNLRDLWPDTEQEWFERWERVATTGESIQFDMFHAPTGRHYLGSMFRVDEKTGRFCVSFQDMTERIKTEEALRTREEQLRQSQKMEAIGQLAGGIAHDFNNMLAGIMGYAELVEDDQDPNSENRQFCEQIIDTCHRAGELTRQLLAFARKGKYISTPVDVHTIILNAIDLLQRTINRNISIHTTLSADNAYVIGDPSQLQSLILNLGINARDAMPQGGEINIQTSQVELSVEDCDNVPFDIEPGNVLKIEVHDTGTGISPDILNRIFEPFFTTKGVGEGTGLGLAAVYGTITNHNGAILVNSEQGVGTEFVLYLPLSTKKAPERVTIEQVSVESGTILLIDDEPVIRSVGEALLSKQGFTVILAENGLDGIGLYELRKKEIDAVVLDVVMPKMGGLETLERLKEIDPEVKVVMASGFADESRIREFMKMGIEGFVKKPFLKAELIDTVSKAIKG